MIDNHPPQRVTLLRIDHALQTALYSLEAYATTNAGADAEWILHAAEKRVQKALELVRELRGEPS